MICPYYRDTYGLCLACRRGTQYKQTVYKSQGKLNLHKAKKCDQRYTSCNAYRELQQIKKADATA
jgi:hypothetical protein